MNDPHMDQELMKIYEWVDSVPLSRSKKNIARDFSDGVMLAELIHHHIPRIVELHNYPAASNSSQKNYNWVTLNSKVLRKLGLQVTKKEIQDVIACKPNGIERVLKKVFKHVMNYNDTFRLNGTNNADNRSGNISANEDSSNLRSSPQREVFNEIDVNNTRDNNYSSANSYELRQTLEEKDNKIKELKYIIDILEMKLKNSADIQRALEKRVDELSEMIRKNN